MSIPRYSPNPFWFGMPIVDNKEGKLCEYRDYVKLEAENARLKSEVERLQSIHSIDSIGIEQLKAEVERLTELNATISLRYDATKSMLDGCAKEIEEMEAEVERLTEAGDAMAEQLDLEYLISQPARLWRAAKEGKQS